MTPELMKNLAIMAFRYKGSATDFVFEYVSEGCKSITGYSAQEFLEGVKFVELVHPDDACAFMHLHKVTLSVGKSLETTFRICTKAGLEKHIWVRTRVSDTDSEGMPNAYEGFFADITKPLKLETARLANRGKYNFLARISREIRNPMNAILGMAELGMREDSIEKISDYTQTIKQAGNKLMYVLNDIMDYAKIQSGEMEVVPEEYVLASVVHDVVSICNSWLQDKPVDFNIEIDRTMPNFLIGDMLKLRQVILHVLSNAVKFTDTGNVSLAVKGTKKGDDLIVSVTVSDSGRGIRDEDMDNLFEEFAQFDEKSIEGSGLGLTIVESLVKLMDGEIHVSSIFGVGSIVTINVPQGIKNHDEIGEIADILNGKRYYTKEQNEEARKIAKFIAPSARVLIVDDISTNLKVAKGLLRAYNMRIDLCVSGAEAIEAVKTTRYDLILMDHMMPMMNGVEATLCIRELENCKTDCKKVPIVALTANAVHGMKQMFLKNGFNDFFAKPIEIVRLNAIIEKWIPKDKQLPADSEDTEKPAVPVFEIAGIDVKKGIEFAGGNVEFYTAILKSFVDNAIQLSKEMKEYLAAENMESYVVCIHAAKSLLGTIGANEVSYAAEPLEYKAQKGDTTYVAQKHPAFSLALENLIDSICEFLENEDA
jgi:PAS domain S-box-containing protein